MLSFGIASNSADFRPKPAIQSSDSFWHKQLRSAKKPDMCKNIWGIDWIWFYQLFFVLKNRFVSGMEAL